jgi:hypothetical protein
MDVRLMWESNDGIFPWGVEVPLVHPQRVLSRVLAHGQAREWLHDQHCGPHQRGRLYARDRDVQHCV